MNNVFVRLIGLLVVFLASSSSAQTTISTAQAALLQSVGSASVIPSVGAPTWSELTTLQQEALQPLKGMWNTLGDIHRKKWLIAVNDYQHLPMAEQQKIRERMVLWSKLTPNERAQARNNFAATKHNDSADKVSKWQEYQALSKEDKKNFGQSALAKSRKKGAAKVPQTTKSAPLRAASTETTAYSPRHPPSTAEMQRLWEGLNPHTLLPRQ